MKLFASTSSLWHHDLDSGVSDLFTAGFDGVELSRSPYDSGISEKMATWRSLGELSIHNYFPRPKVDFVFNLASGNPQIAEMSLNHARSAIEIADDHNIAWVSFHAGYLIDPSPSELGHPVRFRNPAARSTALADFVRRAKDIVSEAASRGITVLWENNVLTPLNLATFGMNPFLLVDADEILFFDSEMPSNSGILLDVAHLSVSCASLSADRVSSLKRIGPTVRGLHLSEDDGESDNGGLITSESWFWEFLPSHVEYCVVESHFKSLDEAREQRHIVRKSFRVFQERLAKSFVEEPSENCV